MFCRLLGYPYREKNVKIKSRPARITSEVLLYIIALLHFCRILYQILVRGALIAQKLQRKRLNLIPVDEGDDADNDNSSSEAKSSQDYIQVCLGEKNKVRDDKETMYNRHLRESFGPFIYSIVFLGCLWGIIILSPIANGARWRMGLLASLVLVVPLFLGPALDTWVSALRRPHNNPARAGYRRDYFQLPISSLLAPTGFFVLFPYEREYQIWCYVQIFLRILTTREMLVPVVFFYFAFVSHTQIIRYFVNYLTF